MDHVKYKIAALIMNIRGSLFPLLLPLHLIAQTSGVLDPTFGGSGFVISNGDVFLEHSHSILLQQDGKIIAIGTAVPNSNDVGVARFLPDGQPDTSFGGSGAVAVDIENTEFAYGSALQADGKILIAAMTHLDTTYKAVLLRLQSNGALDPSFGIGGIHELYFPGGAAYFYDCTVQPDGYIVACGMVGNEMLLHRVDPSGTPDPAFGIMGTVRAQYNGLPTTAESVALQPNGQIVVCGAPGVVARFDPDGTQDLLGFGTNGWADLPGDVTPHHFADVILQPDGRILVAGGPSLLPPDTLLVIRSMTDGTPDTSFGSDGSVALPILDGSTSMALALRADGRIITLGTVLDQGTSRMMLSRLGSDGVLDTAFGQSGTTTLTLAMPPPHHEIGSDVLVTQNGDILGTAAHFSADNGFLVARFSDPYQAENVPSASRPGEFHVFPNPVADLVTIERRDGPCDQLRVTLVDATGREVMSKQGSHLRAMTIDLAGLPQGAYVLRIGTDEGRSAQLMIKE